VGRGDGRTTLRGYMRTYVCIVALVVANCSSAQTITGSIMGSVRDTSSAPVVSANVTLTQDATGARRQAPTDVRGDFVFSSLQPGEYSLKVESQGFKRLDRTGIRLSAAESLPVGTIVLEVGPVTESIVVTGQPAVVQTASAERAGVVTSSQVDRLLIRGRNVVSLLQLLPGVVDLDDSERLQNNWNLYVQGNRRGTNWMQLDGMMVNGGSNNFNATVNVSMDAVEEVKVLLTNYQAEYGRMAGASIQLVTKSGSREFHGMGSYFKRHEQFNAKNFFNNRLGAPKPRYRYHTWSYNVGGPVVIPGKFNTNRDKLFFFWAQEYWPLRIPLAISQLTVPTPLERNGDFSQSLDLNNRLITIRDPYSNSVPFPNNRIPASSVNPNGKALLGVFPAPNFTDRALSGGRYNYVFQTENHSPTRTETLRLDYNLNDRNLFFGNFSHRLASEEGAMGLPTSGSTNWPQLRKKNVNNGHVVIVRYQRIFGPTLVNELNVGHTWRPWDDEVLADEVTRNQRSQHGFNLGQFAPGINPLSMLPNASFGGVTSPANLAIEGRFPVLYREKNFSLYNNLTKTAGPHTVKMGIYMDRVWIHQAVALNFNGSFDFGSNVNNPLNTNYAYANAALGVFNSYTEATGRPFPHFRVKNLEWFVQDNWRVTRRLTLDYGMRFAWLVPLFERDNLMSGFVPERYNASRQVKLIEPRMVEGRRMGVDPATGRVYAPNLIGSIAPGTGDAANGLVATAAASDYPDALIENRGVHYGPRFGFAFDLFGSGRTAIRGGAGIFYNRQDVANALIPFTTQAPLVANPTYYFGEMRTLFNTAGLVSPQNVFGLERAGKLPTVMNHSLSIQQRLGPETVVDVGYVGSLGRHLMWQRNVNAVPFGTNFDPANIDPTTKLPYAANFLRTFMGFGEIYMRDWASSSNYH